MPGFPIRTPWDHSSVDSSPRPIAASHVLHRLPVPRHPPSALDNLTTKMLASTMHISTNNPPTTTHPTPRPETSQDRKASRRHCGMRGPAMPGSPEKPTHTGLFLQDPTGCPPPPASRTPRVVPCSTPLSR